MNKLNAPKASLGLTKVFWSRGKNGNPASCYISTVDVLAPAECGHSQDVLPPAVEGEDGALLLLVQHRVPASPVTGVTQALAELKAGSGSG